jgi:tetratricopeptide (TPR) repeat protein
MADDARSVEQVRPLLPGTAGCAVIVTSRSRMGGLAGAYLQHLEPLPPGAAVEMLGRIAGPQRVAREAEASDKLVAACGYLPLALRIVGAKLATRPAWPIRRVVDLVADQRRRLDELAVDDLAFRASVMPSYQALDERGQRAFRRLGLLWPTDVAEWVIAALLGEPNASDVVNQLVDRSLLMPVGTDATGEPRYRLHDLLRDYAIEQLDQEQQWEREAALERALTGWLQIAAAADCRLPRVPAILRRGAPGAGIVAPDAAAALAVDPITWFTAERFNLMAAVECACATGGYQLAAQLAAQQAAFQFFQARLNEAEQMWHSVLAAAQSAGDSGASAHAELHLVQFMAERGKNAEALVTLRRCGEVLEQVGDQEALALVLQWRSYCAEEQGLLRQAQRDGQQGIDAARRVRDRHCELSCLRVLGQVMTRLGDYAAGLEAGGQAVALARELREPYAEYETLHTLAHANNVAGRYTTAVELCLQAMEKVLVVGYEVGEGYVLGSLGDAYHGRGSHYEAIDALSSAQRIFQDRGIQRGYALCLLKRARAYQAVGRHEQAAQCSKESLPVFRALHLTAYEQQVLQVLEECGDGASG